PHPPSNKIKHLMSAPTGTLLATQKHICPKQEKITMTNIGPITGGQGKHPLDITKLQKLELDPASIRKLDPDTIARLRQAEEARFTRPVNLQDHPSQKIYATVEINGKTIATLYNGG